MSYKCEIKEQPTQPTLTIRKKTSIKDISQVLGKAFGEIIIHIMGLGEQPSGPPFVAYYNMDMQNLDIEIGFPVSKKLSGKGDIKSNEIPGGKFATCLHIGPYDKVEAAYSALTDWIKNNGYESTGVAYEIYVNDPRETPPQELETQIMFPLK